MKKCPFCLKHNDDGAMFCQYCGNRLTIEQPAPHFTSDNVQTPKEKIGKVKNSILTLWDSGRKGKVALGCGASILLSICCFIFGAIYTSSPEYKATATYEKAITETNSYESTMNALVAQFSPTQDKTPTVINESVESASSSIPTDEIIIPDNPEMACIPRNTKREIGVVSSVVDGDTIHVVIDGVDYPLRYIGMDCPESTTEQEYYGQEATSYNQQLVSGKTVILVSDVSETDVFDRLLRYVIVDNIFVNYELVKNGYAVAKSYPPDTACNQIYQEAQNQISVINGGLWSYQPSLTPAQVIIAPTAEAMVIAPTTASLCPQGCTEQLPGCAIKGNINSDGVKIYHVPSSTSYEKTKIKPEDGERWFCTEAEAIANGWRAPYN